MMSNWEGGSERQDEEESGVAKSAENHMPSFLLNISIAALILLVVKFCCLACLFRHFKNGNRNLSTTVQLVTKLLGLGFTLLHLGFAVPFNVSVLLPLVKISLYPSSMLN